MEEYDKNIVSNENKHEQSQRYNREYSDTLLELADNLAQVRQAVKKGLSIWAVTLEGNGPPEADRRFFTPEEARSISVLCYELLWLDADVLLQARAGEQVNAVTERVRQAMRVLDRADRLGLGPTRAGLSLRAACLKRLNRLEEARKVAQDAQALPPDLAADFFLIGLEHYRRQEYEQAVAPLSAALKRQPDHFGAEYLLAVCRLRDRNAQRKPNFQAAKEGLERCLERRKDFVWAKLLRGFAEMEMGQWNGALADFDAVIASRPNRMAEYVAHVNRGVLAVKRRQWDNATRDFEKAVSINADAFAAYLNLAVMHRQRAEPWREPILYLGAGPLAVLHAPTLAGWRRDAWHAAVDALDRALARRSDIATLYHDRARLHLLLGAGDKARLDLTRAIALTPELGSPRLADDLFELGRLLYEGDEFREAVVVLELLLTKVQPDHAEGWRLKAQALLARHLDVAAGVALDRYLELTRTRRELRTTKEVRQQSESYLARGILHGKRKDFRSAAECYTRGLELLRDRRLLRERGRAYLMVGAPGLAKADFEELLNGNPGDGDARLGLADACVRLGEWQTALQDVELGLSQAERTPRSLYTAARVHAQAHVRLLAEKQGPLRNPLKERTRERTVELLREALLLEPVEKRRAFWGDFVERDPALTLLSNAPAMRQLAQEVRSGGE